MRPNSFEDPSTNPACASIDVFTRFDDARADWLALSREAVISPYQSFAFLSAWSKTVGPSEGVEPFIIVARDAAGRPSALLPLCIADRKIRIALFLGGRECNFNLPLLRPDAGHDGASLRDLLKQAARRASQPPDFYYLRNQPQCFEGRENPLVFAGSQASPSFAFGATLPADPNVLATRLSKDTRKKLRRKEARLAELGPVVCEHHVTGPRGAEIIDALMRQKDARFAVGKAFTRGNISALLDVLSATEVDGRVELHGLRVGERIVATYAGVVRGNRFSAMLNSFEQDDVGVARCSPGELLLHALMRDLVSRGVTHFDLGSGEARYKNQVCDETIPLYDTIIPVTARGALAAPLLSAYLRLKRRIKRSPTLSRAYYQLHAALNR